MNFSDLPITNAMVDVVLNHDSGYPDELARLDSPEAMCAAFGDTNREFPDSLWIEPRDRKAKAEENDRLGLWAADYIDRYTNQGGGNGGYSTHECTTHALRAVAEACWNRQRRISLGGPKVGERLPISEESASVWFSCLSIYAEANPREWGGANCQQVCRIACERGFLPDHTQPKNYGFKHTLQGTCGAGGVNQSRGNFPGWSGSTFRNPPSTWEDSDWRETAKHFKPLECVYPRNTDEFQCLLLHGYAIGIGRSGHSVPIVGMKYEGSRVYYPYFDSYDRLLYDSRAYYSGAYSILTMTAPDDWSKPAG